MELLIVTAFVLILLWVLFILPQQRRERAHRALVGNLQHGDEVIITAGIYGTIVGLAPEHIVLEVSRGVEIKVARQAVLRRVENALPDDTQPNPPWDD